MCLLNKKKLNLIKDFTSFLNNPFENKRYVLSEKDNFYFTWIDAKFSTDYVRNLNITSSDRYKKYFKKHQQLRNIPIWIKSGRKVKYWDLYDLYKTIILHGLDFSTVNIEVSFISPMGPFQKDDFKNIINHEIYHDILVELLLNQELNERNFRFRVDGLVKCLNADDKSFYINVSQVSNDGILFSLKDTKALEELVSSNDVRFLFDTLLLKKTSKMSLEGISNNFSSFPFKLFLTNDKYFSQEIRMSDVRVTYQFDNFSEFTNYLYVPFSNIKSHKDNLKEHITNFSDNLKHELEKKTKNSQPLFLVK